MLLLAVKGYFFYLLEMQKFNGRKWVCIYDNNPLVHVVSILALLR